jgi:type VI secretion system protein ImpB
VQLPFVMGVLSDLSGKPASRCRRSPTASSSKSTSTTSTPHEGDEAARRLPGAEHAHRRRQPAVDITFESMDDFSPAAVARKVDGLNKLLEARQQLANLVTYMDGKTGAEELIAKVLHDPALLQLADREAKPQE